MIVDILLISVGTIFLLTGIIGCVVPILPGPPISFAGLLLMHISDRIDFPHSLLWILFAVTVIVTIIDYIVPAWIVKKTKGSRYAKNGALIGSILGVFVFPPWGIIFGALAGAFIGELIYTNNITQASKSGIAAFGGFMLGTALKLSASIYMMWVAARQLFGA